VHRRGRDDERPGVRRRRAEHQRGDPADHGVGEPDQREAEQAVGDRVRDRVPDRVEHRGQQGDGDDGEGEWGDRRT